MGRSDKVGLKEGEWFKGEDEWGAKGELVPAWRGVVVVRARDSMALSWGAGKGVAQGEV